VAVGFHADRVNTTRPEPMLPVKSFSRRHIVGLIEVELNSSAPPYCAICKRFGTWSDGRSPHASAPSMKQCGWLE